MGRSRGGLTTKLHFAVDALGKPLRMILSAGQVADIECAHDLIADMPCASLVADKGYDANALVMSIEASGAQAVIPPRSNGIAPRHYDRCAYRARNLIERFFNRIKHYRRIATRYDKLACSYMAFVRIVCAVISYRYM
nr:IS5 family transposase [Thauera propionica]